MLTLCIRGDSMIELLKRYKVVVLFFILAIANLSWYIIKEIKAKEVSIRLNPESHKIQPLQERDSEHITILEEEILAGHEQDLADLQHNEGVQPASYVQVPVYICGEIMSPGVYYVHSTAIINDVVQMGGGLTLNADHNYLNLASKVVPNQKIYIPKIGEEIDKYLNSYDNKEGTVSQNTNTSISGVEPGGQARISMININTATEKELQTLTGIGEVKARAIIEYRMSIGRFKRVDELLNVTGIGDKTLEKIRVFITV